METVSSWFLRKIDDLKGTLRGVIHVGAHFGQELEHYEARGAHHQVWIEPQPDIYKKLVRRLPKRSNVHSFNVACGSSAAASADFFLISNSHGEASSLLQPTGHLRLYPHMKPEKTIKVPVQPLENLLKSKKIDVSNFNLLVVDAQGSELDVLMGGSGNRPPNGVRSGRGKQGRAL